MRKIASLLLLFSVTVSAQDLGQRLDQLMQKYNNVGALNGAVIVAENGVVSYAKGFGLADVEKGLRNGPDVQYRIASITKIFTSALIMKLVEQGKVKLQDPLITYLPEYRQDTGAKITIHHLLTHSSGIPNYVASAEWRRHVEQPMPELAEFIRTYCSGDLEFEPGNRFSYSNSGYVLLGAIIEKVTGMPYAQALRTMVLEPAGLTNSGLDNHELQLPKRAIGYTASFGPISQTAAPWNIDWAYAAGGMYATPEDMVRWDEALSSGKVISKQSVSRMGTPFFKAFQPGFSYGYGITVSRGVKTKEGDSLLMMSHDGGLPGFNSLFSRVPARKQVVFVVSNTGDAPLRTITQGIFDILNGLEPAAVRKSFAKELFGSIESKGLPAGLAAVESENKNLPMSVSEVELNQLGYQYLGQNKYHEAEAIFALNIREFPKSFNVYDSMGECYLKMGDKASARKYYQKSVDLNPKNTGGIEALKTLGTP